MKINAVSQNGIIKKYDAILTYHSEEYNKHYVVYTDNEIDVHNKLKIYAHEKMSDSFSRLNKGVALCNIIGEDSIRTTPLTLRDEFNLSAKIKE